ncbi:hypothetical protein FOA52_005279 [Chlamydomonas sp. UWO 241]|nr:hypothetical protein FOA52_005279 [Chlamydomonas sp. UWO 241]
MQALQANEVAEALAAIDLAHAVLLSEDLFTQALWRWLDADGKAALRGVSKHIRSLMDGSITRVASLRQGFVTAVLASALLRWPAVRDLTLRQVQAPQVGALFIPAPSSSVAASLQVIDISGCASLNSIDFVRSCAQLSWCCS